MSPVYLCVPLQNRRQCSFCEIIFSHRACIHLSTAEDTNKPHTIIVYSFWSFFLFHLWTSMRGEKKKGKKSQSKTKQNKTHLKILLTGCGSSAKIPQEKSSVTWFTWKCCPWIFWTKRGSFSVCRCHWLPSMPEKHHPLLLLQPRGPCSEPSDPGYCSLPVARTGQ